MLYFITINCHVVMTSLTPHDPRKEQAPVNRNDYHFRFIEPGASPLYVYRRSVKAAAHIYRWLNLWKPGV